MSALLDVLWAVEKECSNLCFGCWYYWWL